MISNKANNSNEEKNYPWKTPWPEQELESVNSCPVCQSDSRKVHHKGLVDNVFYCAPGEWTSWVCRKCLSEYLDPRPTPDSNKLAYGNYYTHLEVSDKFEYKKLSYLRKIRRELVNGYTNWQFGTKESPSNSIGIIILTLLRPYKKRIDREYRNLPKLKFQGKLLDLGCGSGDFLKIAELCDWDAVGIDTDIKAVENCRKQGLRVFQGGIDYFKDKAELFDVITLNHVVEHLHDPVAVLDDCWRLLKPKGQIWLETPNSKSSGHVRYGKNWRGLEPPRHLVLFNKNSLYGALQSVGFKKIKAVSNMSPVVLMSKASIAIQKNLPIDYELKLTIEERIKILIDYFIQKVNPDRKEFITTIGIK